MTTKDRLSVLQQQSPPFGGFLAIPLAQVEKVFLSPGPLYEPAARKNIVIDMIMELFEKTGIGAGDVVINTFSYHIGPFAHWLDEAIRQAGAIVVPMGVGATDLQIKLLHDLKVTAYVGTPSWLNTLLQKIEETGLNFRENFALTKVVVSAEPLPPPLRQKFVETYGFRVANVYGASDVGMIAYNTEGGFAMRLFAGSIIQVVNPDTGKSVGPGEVGEVVLTTFNETYPMIRLGMGDMAMNIDPAPGQSQQGDRSIILVGRVGDALKVRGLFVHPNQLRFSLQRVPTVARAQGVITRDADARDELTLRVVLAPGHEGDDRAALEAAIGEAVRSLCRVKVDRVEFLAADALAADAKVLVDERAW